MDLKIRDVADLLNVSESTIRRWLAEGKIPAYRLNNQFRFSRSEIEQWMLLHKPGENPTSLPYGIEPALQIDDESPSPRSGSRQFSLYRALNKGEVYHSVSGKTKEEIICQTAHKLAQNLHLDPDVLSELLIDREQLQPTALNHGFAIPHARDFLLSSHYDVMAVVFPEQPLEYGALDGEPVHTLFFLFACEDKRHLHLLAKTALLCSDPTVVAFFKTHPPKDKLLEFVKKWESSLAK